MMQWAACTDQPLYQVFLDLTKAYDTLDRQRALDILGQYGVGQNTIRLLQRYWQSNLLVPKQSGFFGEAFRAGRGVTQGDIVSPTIFNIMVDAVLRVWHKEMHLSLDTTTLMATFYADDGRLAGADPDRVQH